MKECPHREDGKDSENLTVWNPVNFYCCRFEKTEAL